jgi:hypothetical protein
MIQFSTSRTLNATAKPSLPRAWRVGIGPSDAFRPHSDHFESWGLWGKPDEARRKAFTRVLRGIAPDPPCRLHSPLPKLNQLPQSNATNMVARLLYDRTAVFVGQTLNPGPRMPWSAKSSGNQSWPQYGFVCQNLAGGPPVNSRPICRCNPQALSSQGRLSPDAVNPLTRA